MVPATLRAHDDSHYCDDPKRGGDVTGRRAHTHSRKKILVKSSITPRTTREGATRRRPTIAMSIVTYVVQRELKELLRALLAVPGELGVNLLPPPPPSCYLHNTWHPSAVSLTQGLGDPEYLSTIVGPFVVDLHTHPLSLQIEQDARYNPPSGFDCKHAVLSPVPIYVVTPEGLWSVGPNAALRALLEEDFPALRLLQPKLVDEGMSHSSVDLGWGLTHEKQDKLADLLEVVENNTNNAAATFAWGLDEFGGLQDPIDAVAHYIEAMDTNLEITPDGGEGMTVHLQPWDADVDWELTGVYYADSWRQQPRQHHQHHYPVTPNDRHDPKFWSTIEATAPWHIVRFQPHADPPATKTGGSRAPFARLPEVTSSSSSLPPRSS